MTVSRPAQLGQEVPVTWFSLGAGTSITPEFYDCTTLYLGGEGSGTFCSWAATPMTSPCTPPAALGAARNAVRHLHRQRPIYTEIIIKKENLTMNSILKAGAATELKDLISYEEGSIANLDLAHTDNMKFVLMAFDEAPA